MRIPFFHVDAFTRTVLGGNPAVVCFLERWLRPETMQAIAAENNLSETSFLVKREADDADYDLRWFTPTKEVDLCGHATLAAGFAVLERDRSRARRVRFSTQSGILDVERTGSDLLGLSLPIRAAEPSRDPGLLAAVTDALGRAPVELHRAPRDLMAVFADEEDVCSLTPSFERIAQLECVALIATAPGTPGTKVDFVSRVFAPAYGIPEDPVTGSSHCTLVPYWSGRLGKKQLSARQRSRRGGELECTLFDDRVLVAGGAALYASGEIFVDG